MTICSVWLCLERVSGWRRGSSELKFGRVRVGNKLPMGLASALALIGGQPRASIPAAGFGSANSSLLPPGRRRLKPSAASCDSTAGSPLAGATRSSLAAPARLLLIGSRLARGCAWKSSSATDAPMTFAADSAKAAAAASSCPCAGPHCVVLGRRKRPPSTCARAPQPARGL